jgi:hypothetical protein
MTKFTVQCGYAAYYSRTQTVEADTLDEALDAAIAEANAHDDWVSEDVSSNTFIEAIAEGDDVDLWSDAARQLSIPARFTERGEGPRIIIILKNHRVESVAISGGYARVELRDYDRADPNAQTDAEGRRYALTDWSNVIPRKAE